ncbi:hypothetical protein QOT17_25643 [Balamuthia mandrillaris]
MIKKRTHINPSIRLSLSLSLFFVLRIDGSETHGNGNVGGAQEEMEEVHFLQAQEEGAPGAHDASHHVQRDAAQHQQAGLGLGVGADLLQVGGSAAPLPLMVPQVTQSEETGEEAEAGGHAVVAHLVEEEEQPEDGEGLKHELVGLPHEEAPGRETQQGQAHELAESGKELVEEDDWPDLEGKAKDAQGGGHPHHKEADGRVEAGHGEGAEVGRHGVQAGHLAILEGGGEIFGVDVKEDRNGVGAGHAQQSVRERGRPLRFSPGRLLLLLL